MRPMIMRMFATNEEMSIPQSKKLYEGILVAIPDKYSRLPRKSICIVKPRKIEITVTIVIMPRAIKMSATKLTNLLLFIICLLRL